jgi:hypothetical protein
MFQRQLTITSNYLSPGCQRTSHPLDHTTNSLGHTSGQPNALGLIFHLPSIDYLNSYEIHLKLTGRKPSESCITLFPLRTFASGWETCSPVLGTPILTGQCGVLFWFQVSNAVKGPINRNNWHKTRYIIT